MKQMTLTTTVFPDNQKTVTKTTICLEPDRGTENQVVNLYPQVKFQTLEGFGGACTDSAAYVYSQMDETQKEALVHSYFDEDKLNYGLVRMTVDSCDFSREHYEAMGKADDEALASFSLERAGQYVFPMMDDIRRISGKRIEVMVSPWSPPAFMKTNGERDHGGSLKPEYRGLWAEYLCRYIKEYRARGYQVTRMSIQNEPKAVQTWDSCIYTPEEEKVFLRDFLHPALVKNGLEDIEIFIWDHNKERIFERTCAIIDEETDALVKGIAFHWYSGDHFEALDCIRRRFPDKVLALSEACIEYSKYSAGDYLNNAQKYAHDMIGNFNGGMNAFYDWNLLLDQQGGPNHVGNFCDAPWLFDLEEKKLMERNTLSYIWHFSAFIKPGARRIGYSRYTQDVELTAFENPDGMLAAVFLNQNDKELPVVLRVQGQEAEFVLPPKSISTGILRGSKDEV